MTPWRRSFGVRTLEVAGREKSVRASALVGAGLLAMLTTPAVALDLNLRCEGQSISSGAKTATTTFDVPDGPDVKGTTTVRTQEILPDQLMVKVIGGTIQVRPPEAFMPVFGKRPEGDWYPLYDAKITDSEISGRWRFKALYKPRLRIDRATGAVSAEGPYIVFRGDCEVADPAARKF